MRPRSHQFYIIQYNTEQNCAVKAAREFSCCAARDEIFIILYLWIRHSGQHAAQ